jgi:protein tyrosine phosphatase (PTP) superfamily phosphohydrolase (DUF442 family)
LILILTGRIFNFESEPPVFERSFSGPASNGYTPPDTSIVDEQFNFHFVTPFLWRSAQPSEKSIQRMKDHGLKALINLKRDEQNHAWERSVAEKMGLQYYYFPMDAEGDHDLDQIAEILDVIKDPANHPVLIHCHGGKDRTGLVSSIFKIEYTEEDFNDIYKEMLVFGYHQERFPSVLKTIRRWCEIHHRSEIADKIAPDGHGLIES